jgi:hypothetical protein
VANKQTRVSRTTTEDLTAAWVIEHKTAVVVFLIALAVLIFLAGTWWQEAQLHHAGLL